MFYFSNFPNIFQLVFCLENVLSTGLYDGANKCVSHSIDIEGLIIFVVRYPPERVIILRLNPFETAIPFAHSDHH